MTEAVAFTAHLHGGTFGDCIGNMLLHLLHRLGINHRPRGHARIHAITHMQLTHRIGQLLRKRIIHTALHIQTVRTHTGLTCIAILRRNCTLNRRIQIRIIKHNERRIATQLHRHLLHRWRTLLNQLATHLSRTGERQLTHRRILRKLRTDERRTTGNHLKHPRRNARTVRQFSQSQRRERRQIRRTHHHRATRRERRPRFARNHRRRKVPRRDCHAHPDWLLRHHDALIHGMGWNRIAINALTFLSEPFEETGRIHDFAFGFRQRFALLTGHNQRQIICIRNHQIEPLLQDVRALLRGLLAPSRPCRIRISDGLSSVFTPQFRYMADEFTGGRIGHGGGFGTVHPCAVEVTLLLE